MTSSGHTPQGRTAESCRAQAAEGGLGRLPDQLGSALSRPHLPALDGLRAIAAFLVVFYHCGFAWCPGGLGVLAFFVLSGFLITWLLLKEEEQCGKISVKMFYVRRVLRIFPAFYAFWLLVVGALVIFHKHIAWPQAICSFFYVNNYYQAIFGDPNTGLSHTWSLGIEEQFYLLWPTLFLLLRRNTSRVRFLCTAIVLVWIYRLILVLGFSGHQGYVYEAFDTRADHLAVGCLLAIALREGIWGRLWRWLCAVTWLPWVTVACLVLSTIAANVAPASYRYRDSVGFLIDPLLVAVLIVQAMATSRLGFGAMLGWGWMGYLGRISYSVYLYQQVVSAKKLTVHYPMLYVPATVLMIVLAASGSYWLIEKPFLRMKDRFSPQRAAAKSA